MELIRTIKLKLTNNTEMFRETVQAYTNAFNYVCRTSLDSQDFNGVSLHHKTYSECRKTLSADLAISARVKATEAMHSYRTLKKNAEKENQKRLKWNEKHPDRRPRRLMRIPRCPQSRNASIRYNDKTFTVWFDRNELSIQTLNGRQRLRFEVPEYYRQYLSWKRRSAELFIRKNVVFLNITFSKEVTDTPYNNLFVGVDRGIKRIAVTSDNRFFGGGALKHVSNRYADLRKRLQAVGTKSSKRHLRKMRSKENRYRRDVNHCITKQIVNTLQPGTTLLLEDLTGIRGGSFKLRKEERKEVNKWNFFQFEQFLSYKAAGHGCYVEFVDARYTSQRCSRCGYTAKANRASQTVFCCKHCGFKLNADLNGSRNIVSKHLDSISSPGGAALNQPIVSTLRS